MLGSLRGWLPQGKANQSGHRCSTLVASFPSPASPLCCRAWSYSTRGQSSVAMPCVVIWTSLSSAQLLGFGSVHQSLVRLCRRLRRNGQAHLSSAVLRRALTMHCDLGLTLIDSDSQMQDSLAPDFRQHFSR